MNKTKLIAAGKEALRILVFALPAILIQVFTDNPALAGTYGGTILLILRSWDKAIHEDKSTETKGLLPF